MDSQETVAPGEAKRKSTLRYFLIMLFGVLACMCSGAYFGLKTTEALHLSVACGQETFSAGVTSDQCKEWSQKVWLASPSDYEKCMELRPEDSEIFNDVYQCLEDRGLGVNDLE
jgi:hypothetical protein